MSVDLADVALNTLADFIGLNIPGLTVLREFPYANQKLNYPSVTISTNKPKRMPCMPYTNGPLSSPDSTGKVIAQEVVAFWEDTFQMDLWTRDKLERGILTEKVISLFNSQELNQNGTDSSDGLSLPMESHYGQFCRYEIDTVQCVDDEAAAQRQERREKITVLINCCEIRQRTYYTMKTIQIQAEVDDDSSSDSDSYNVPNE